MGHRTFRERERCLLGIERLISCISNESCWSLGHWACLVIQVTVVFHSMPNKPRCKVNRNAIPINTTKGFRNENLNSMHIQYADVACWLYIPGKKLCFATCLCVSRLFVWYIREKKRRSRAMELFGGISVLLECLQVWID